LIFLVLLAYIVSHLFHLYVDKEYHDARLSNLIFCLLGVPEDNRINEIKALFLCAPDIDVEMRKEAIDKLGDYGNNGILTIKHLIGSTRNNDIKGYAFEVIARTKKRNLFVNKIKQTEKIFIL
jgi:hypothetical protein